MGYDFILDAKSIKTMYRRLIIAGYSKTEAGNLIAHIMGLGPSEKGWSVKELQYLHFMEYLDKRDK